jgi:DNA gyrase subunit B
MRSTAPRTSRSSRASSRCASAPRCTSAAPTRNGYHHLLWEIVDNAVDEAINGHASRIEVTLDADHKGATVSTTGAASRSTCTPSTRSPALELILCTLHAGGKFANESYKVSGGLHGVGSSVVNALSRSSRPPSGATATSTRSPTRAAPQAKLVKKVATRKHGTTIHFRPTRRSSAELAFDPTRCASASRPRRTCTRAHDRLPRRGHRERRGPSTTRTASRITCRSSWRSAEKPAGAPDALHCSRRTACASRRPPVDRVDRRARALLRQRHPHAERRPTRAASSSAIVKAVRAYMEAKNIQPKGVTLTAEDIREGMVALLSVYVASRSSRGRRRIA